MLLYLLLLVAEDNVYSGGRVTGYCRGARVTLTTDLRVSGYGISSLRILKSDCRFFFVSGEALEYGQGLSGVRNGPKILLFLKVLGFLWPGDCCFLLKDTMSLVPHQSSLNLIWNSGWWWAWFCSEGAVLIPLNCWRVVVQPEHSALSWDWVAEIVLYFTH